MKQQILFFITLVFVACQANAFNSHNLFPAQQSQFDAQNGKFYGEAGEVVSIPGNFLGFRYDDLHIPGNIPITVTRVYDMFRNASALRVPFSLGNWDIEIPRITGYRSRIHSSGATYDLNASPLEWSKGLCHNPIFHHTSGGNFAQKLAFWIGLHMDIPGAGTQQLLFENQDLDGDGKIEDDEFVYPPGSGKTPTRNINYVTQNNWRADCIDLTQGARSGFSVKSPNGMKYTFDVFAGAKSGINTAMDWYSSLGMAVYASRVEDRFGNYLEYDYIFDANGGAHVQRITSNDGRRVDFEYIDVDLSEHSFWKPVNSVKYLKKVKQIGSNGETLKEVVYNYTNHEPVDTFWDNSFTDTMANTWALESVKTVNGLYWTYEYKDHFSFIAESYLDSDGYNPCTWDGWGECAPTYSTLPAIILSVTTPDDRLHQYTYWWNKRFFSDFLSSLNPGADMDPKRDVWLLNSIITDSNDDGIQETIGFKSLSLWSETARAYLTDSYSDVYHNGTDTVAYTAWGIQNKFNKNELSPDWSCETRSSQNPEIPDTEFCEAENYGDFDERVHWNENRVSANPRREWWVTFSDSMVKYIWRTDLIMEFRVDTDIGLLGSIWLNKDASGVIRSFKKYDLSPRTDGFSDHKLVYSEEYDWNVLRIIGENDVRCWVKYCDKPELYRRVVTEKRTWMDGALFREVYSDFDIYGFNSTTRYISSIPTDELGVVNQDIQKTATYFNDYSPNRWLLGITEDETYLDNLTSKTHSIDRTYNTLGQLLDVSEYGVNRSFTYHSDGNLWTSTYQQQSGVDITYEYLDYFRGIPQLEAHPGDVTIERKVNETGTIQWSKDPLGNLTYFGYDDLNRTNLIDTPQYLSVDIEHLGVLGSKKVTQGRVERYSALNDKGLTLFERTTDTTGIAPSFIHKYDYDSSGRLIFQGRPSETGPGSEGEIISYDAHDRVVSVVDSVDSDTLSYCWGTRCNVGRGGKPKVGMGYVATDPEGYETIVNHMSWFGPGSQYPVEIYQQVSKDPVRYIKTGVEYNFLGQVEKISRAGVDREFFYDSENVLDYVLEPEVGRIDYGYDLAGNITSKKINSNESIIYDYYDNNQLRLIDYPEGLARDVEYGYYDDGQIQYADNGFSRSEYFYNAEGDLRKEITYVEDKIFEVDYHYDEYGAIDRLTYPSGNYVEFRPNVYGDPTEINYASGYEDTLLADSITTNLYGDVNNYQSGNLTYSYQRDDKGRPFRQSYLNSQSDGDSSYQYNFNSRGYLDSLDDLIVPANSLAMTYDGLGRLKTANGPWGNGVLDYDDVSNLIQMDLGSASRTFQHDASTNRLSSVNQGTTIQYDTMGNIANDGVATFDFGLDSNLWSATALGVTASFEYNAFGQRLLKSVDQEAKYSIYTTSGKLLYTEGSKPYDPVEEYIYLKGNLFAKAVCDQNDYDDDHDGIPSCIEERFGLDSNNRYDARHDLDGDGVTNLDEYLLGLNMASFYDSDSDGMSDDWEDANNLDKNDATDAMLDYDGDKVTNIDEYELGSDPRLVEESSLYTFSSAHDFGGRNLGVFTYDAVYHQGYIYLVGIFSNYDSEPNVAKKVIKLDLEGNEQWSITTDAFYQSALIANDKLYISGSNILYSVVNLDTGVIEETKEALNFLVADVTQDENSLYIGGRHYDEVSLSSINGGIVPSESEGNALIVKVTFGGQIEWAHSFGGDGQDFVSKLETLSNGSLAITGRVQNDSDVGPINESGSSGMVLPGSTHLNKVDFLANWGPDAEFNWVTKFNARLGDLHKGNDGTSFVHVDQQPLELKVFDSSGNEIRDIVAVNANSSGRHISSTTMVDNLYAFTGASDGRVEVCGDVRGSNYRTEQFACITDGSTYFYYGGLDNGDQVRNFQMVIEGDNDEVFFIGTFTGNQDFNPSSSHDRVLSATPVPYHKGFVARFQNTTFLLFDTDGDGISNLRDDDDDNDGMLDEWEIHNGLSPLWGGDAGADPDGDGLTNFEESQLKSNPNSVDSDNDGIADNDEVSAGTNPNVNEAALSEAVRVYLEIR